MTVNYKDYAPQKSNPSCEGSEWAIHHAYKVTDTSLKRVLLIGDSICNAYQQEVSEILDGTANVSFWASSKCVTTTGYFRDLDCILSARPVSLISFNNGLHSFTTDYSDWCAAYDSAVKFILARMPEATLALTLCTSVNNSWKNEKVKQFNEHIRELAAELSLPIIDLFSPTESLDKDKEMKDEYHFLPPAVACQGKIISDFILSKL